MGEQRRNEVNLSEYKEFKKLSFQIKRLQKGLQLYEEEEYIESIGIYSSFKNIFNKILTQWINMSIQTIGHDQFWFKVKI